MAGEALKTAVFASALFSQLGFGVTPTVEEKRGDIIQVMLLEKPENLIAFCKGVQKGAPVDSFVVPEPSDMPGYDSQVIMAAGAFTLGSSIELSADAPLRGALRRLDAGRPQLPQRPAGHALGSPGDGQRGPVEPPVKTRSKKPPGHAWRLFLWEKSM